MWRIEASCEEKGKNYREEVRNKEQELTKLLDSIFIDGRNMQQ